MIVRLLSGVQGQFVPANIHLPSHRKNVTTKPAADTIEQAAVWEVCQ